jgi:hypothetical protein
MSIFQSHAVIKMLLKVQAIIFWALMLGLTGQQAQAQRLNHVNMARMVEMSYALPKPCRWGKWVCAPLKNKDSMLGAIFYQSLDLSQVIIVVRGAVEAEDWGINGWVQPEAYVTENGALIHAHKGFYTRALSVADALKEMIEHLALKKSDLFFIFLCRARTQLKSMRGRIQATSNT